MNLLTPADYKSFFNKIPGLCLILAPDLCIAGVSDACLTTLQTTRKLLLGHPLYEIFPQRNTDSTVTGPAALKAALGELCVSGSKNEVVIPTQKYDILQADGKIVEKHWKIRNTPVYKAHHQLSHIMVGIEDFTQIGSATEKLRKNEDSFQLLVNSVKDYAIFLLDPAGRIMSWNKGAERIKGYREEEILGKSFEIFYSEKERESGMPRQNLAMAKRYGHYQQEGWRLRKDGSKFWADVVYTALMDDSGNLYGYSKITRDMTERKKVMAQLESLDQQINQSNDAIYTLDRNIQIQSWNQGAEKLYGYTKEEAIGKDSNILLHTFLNEQELHAIKVTLREHHYWSGELKRKTKSGAELYVNSSITTIRNGEGEITGAIAVNVDITAQKKLRKEIDQLVALVDHFSEAIITRGMNRRVISWNQGAEKLFGYSREEAIGKTISELGFIRFTDNELADIEQEVFRSGVWNAETNYFHRNGSSFYGAVTGNSILDEQGKISSIIFIIRDISRRKKLEEELTKLNEELEEKVKAKTAAIYQNERRFRSLIEKNNDIISLFDESFHIVYRSPSAYRITGWSNEEVLQMPATRNIHPDYLEWAQEKLLDLREKPGKSIPVSFPYLHKNGHYFWVEGTLTNLLQDQYVKAMVLNFHDVSDRKEAEDKRKQLFKELSDYKIALDASSIVSITDQNGIILYANENFCRISKYPETELIGKNHRIINAGYHPVEYFQQLWKTIQQGKIWKGEIKNKARDGSFYWVQATIVPFLDEQGKPYQHIAIRSDITERKLAEEQVALSERRFRKLIENMSDAIVMNDADTTILYQSPSVTRILGYSPEERKGQKVLDYVHPDFLEDYRVLNKKLMESPNIPIPFQYRFQHKNGHYIWLEGVVTNLLGNPGINAYVANYRDITDRKESDLLLQQSLHEKNILSERLSAILNTLPANIALLDANGKILEVNESWKKFADQQGYTGDNYHIGEDYMKIAGTASGREKEDGKAVALGIKNVLEGTADEFVYEYAYLSAREKRWFRMIVTPLQEKSYAGAVVMHMDISELRKLEEERMESKILEQKMITRAMLLGQEKERNAIGVELHDNVNQILVGTKLMLSMARDLAASNQEIIQTSMKYIQEAINENRKIAHELVAPDFKTTSFLEKIYDLTKTMLGKTGLLVQIDKKRFHEELLSDEQKLALYRIVQEQCSNIVKYAAAKNVDMMICTYENIFSMIMADDGKGMNKEKKMNGIGIKNMRSRLSVFNGEAIIHSSPGKGFILEIILPIGKD